jgi:hypothetical protein
MLKFTKSEQDELAHAIREAEAIHAEFEQAASDYNDLITRLTEQFGDATERARGIVEDAANEAESYFDLKSEKWQEGDRGQAYGEWRDRLMQVAGAIGERLEAEETSPPDLPDWVGDLGDDEFLEFTY